MAITVPRYTPDFNPVEKLFALLKMNFIRRAFETRCLCSQVAQVLLALDRELLSKVARGQMRNQFGLEPKVDVIAADRFTFNKPAETPTSDVNKDRCDIVNESRRVRLQKRVLVTPEIQRAREVKLKNFKRGSR